MMYTHIEDIMGEVKTREEVEKIHREVIDAADNAEALKDIKRIEDFIEKYFYELNNEEDEYMIEEHLHAIKEFKSKIQAIQEDDEKEPSIKNIEKIDKLKLKVYAHKRQIKTIIERYPEDFFDYMPGYEFDYYY